MPTRYRSATDLVTQVDDAVRYREAVSEWIYWPSGGSFSKWRLRPTFSRSSQLAIQIRVPYERQDVGNVKGYRLKSFLIRSRISKARKREVEK